MISSLLDVFRPLRWYRNVFMLVGSLLAYTLTEAHLDNILFCIILSFLSLCAVASGNYGINEIFDAKSDSFHPEKKHRAIPSGRISIPLVLLFSFIFYLLGLALITVIESRSLHISLFLLFISGLMYNIPPVRLKDKPFLDFTSEALNNAIRVSVGWYSVAKESEIVPSSLLILFWFLGVFLMASKRFGEIRFIKDKETYTSYRKSLSYYSEKNLLISMIVAISVFNFMLGALAFKYQIDLVIILPFLITWIAWYFVIAYEENSIIKDPERIFEKKGFLFFTIFSTTLMAVLLLTKLNLMNFLTLSGMNR